MGIVCILGSTISFAFQTPEQIENHSKQTLLRGLTLMRTGFPDRAVNLYAEGLKVNPYNVALLAAMADAQKAKGDNGLAVFYLDRALQVDSTNISIISQAIDLAMESGNAVQSVDLSARRVRLQPSSAAIHVQHVELLLNLQQIETAASLSKQYIQLFEQSEPVIRAGLTAFVAAGDLDEAMIAATNLTHLDNSPENWYQLATIQLRLGNKEGALNSVVTTLNLDPFHEGGLQLKEQLLVESSTDILAGDQAEMDKETAFFKTGLSSEEKATQLKASGDFQALLTLARAEIETDPRKLSMWDFALEAYFELGEHQNSQDLARDGILLFPGYAPLLFQLARSSFYLGQYESSRNEARQALEHAQSDTKLVKKLNALLTELQQHQ